MAFVIQGKVQMDSTGFHRALAGMRAAAAPAGKQIGSQLSGAILSVFGAGAAVALFRKNLQNAFDIRKGAGRERLNTDTFQTLQKLSDRTGTSVEALAEAYKHGIETGDEFAKTIDEATEAYRQQGNIIKSETVTRLAELKDKLDELLGKLAPVITKVIDTILDGYNRMNKVVGAAVDAAVNGKWKWTPFGPVLVQAPPKDVPGIDTPEEASNDPIRAAAEAATEIAKSKLDEEKKSKPARERSVGDLKVSEATSVGAFFGRAGAGPGPVETRLDILNREVRAINVKIATFR